MRHGGEECLFVGGGEEREEREDFFLRLKSKETLSLSLSWPLAPLDLSESAGNGVLRSSFPGDRKRASRGSKRWREPGLAAFFNFFDRMLFDDDDDDDNGKKQKTETNLELGDLSRVLFLGRWREKMRRA